jgi:hypothetical protein
VIWPNSGNGGLTADNSDEFRRIKARLHRQLISAIDFSAIGSLKDEELRKEVRAATEQLCNQSGELLSQANREALISEMMDETFGLGPLQSLMSDSEISDILVNGAADIYVERRGILEHVVSVRRIHPGLPPPKPAAREGDCRGSAGPWGASIGACRWPLPWLQPHNGGSQRTDDPISTLTP